MPYSRFGREEECYSLRLVGVAAGKSSNPSIRSDLSVKLQGAVQL